ncbi:uncharacterized protein [Dendropsophus ebraccatus]|uniref:uncharacterized protein n=1 Tax=Dendropsophus ebraccatus TaxID=150705 RepID=UPI0038316939
MERDRKPLTRTWAVGSVNRDITFTLNLSPKPICSKDAPRKPQCTRSKAFSASTENQRSHLLFQRLLLCGVKGKERTHQSALSYGGHMLGRSSDRMADTQITERRLLLRMGVILLTLLHPAAGILQIRRVDSPIESSMGHDTTLPCIFYGYETSPLDLSTVSVRWMLRTSEGKEKQIYWLHAGNHTQTRPGSHIPDSGLMGGDGSLYISNIQPSDEGEYTCTVIVTPEKAIRKVTMEVSAVPTCTVSDPRLEMHPDTERSVTCYMSGFYPEPVKVRWLRYIKASSSKAKVDNRTCTSIPVQSHDGTYNVQSVMSVRAMSTEEDGDVYSCVILHKSLRDDALTCNVTISVQPIADNTALITGIVLGILFLPLVVALFLIYRRNIKMEPTEILDIVVPELIHGKKTSMTCPIINFRPRNIKIYLYLKKDNEETLVDSWTTGRTGSDEEAPLLHHPVMLDPVISSPINGVFSCICSIYITPDLQEHSGAKLILEVHHEALKSPIRKDVTLRVTEPPEVLDIIAPELIHGKKTILRCDIIHFSPENIKVKLYFNKDNKKTLVDCWPNRSNKEVSLLSHLLMLKPVMSPPVHGDSSCTCYIYVTPDVYVHNGAKLILKVHHEALEDPIRKKLRMRVAAPPEVSDISAPELIYGKKTTLTCDIINFSPKNIEIKLYLKKDNKNTIEASWTPKKTESNKEVSLLNRLLMLKPVISPVVHGVSSCTCSISIRPDVQEHNEAKLILEVHHEALTSPIRKDVTLRVMGRNELSYY